MQNPSAVVDAIVPVSINAILTMSWVITLNVWEKSPQFLMLFAIVQVTDVSAVFFLAVTVQANVDPGESRVTAIIRPKVPE